jgi:hypothetical protein
MDAFTDLEKSYSQLVKKWDAIERKLEMVISFQATKVEKQLTISPRIKNPIIMRN